MSNYDILSEKENLGKELFLNRVEKICKFGYDSKVPIFIDAEESWIQDIIDEISVKMMKKFNLQETWIFNTLQLYRKDRLAYLHKILSDSRKNNYFLGLKLVRGAYHEQEIKRAKEMNYSCPVFTKKEDTDRDYNLAIKLCIDNIDKIGGVISGIESGYFQKEIADSASLYNNKIENKDRIIVGVNEFVKEDEKIDIPILEISDEVQ